MLVLLPLLLRIVVRSGQGYRRGVTPWLFARRYALVWLGWYDSDEVVWMRVAAGAASAEAAE